MEFPAKILKSSLVVPGQLVVSARVQVTLVRFMRLNAKVDFLMGLDERENVDSAWVTQEPIDGAALPSLVGVPEAGAHVLFLGTVRQFTDSSNTGFHDLGDPVMIDGRQVIQTVALEYDCYPAMAQKAMAALLAEARSRWDLCRQVMVHRVGRLELCETAIAIAVSSAHRKNAFAATEFLIDQVKVHVPVWKREILPDGSGHWIHPGVPSQR